MKFCYLWGHTNNEHAIDYSKKNIWNSLKEKTIEQTRIR